MITVGEIMKSKYQTISPDISVRDAAKKMAELEIGMVVVVSEDKRSIVGIFSERDVMKKVVAKGLPYEHATVANLMTTNVVTVEKKADVLDAWRMMKDGKFRHLPVVGAQGEIVGVLGARDILDYLANNGQLIDLLAKR